MGYINKHLIKGEKIIFNGQRHWMVFLRPIFWLLVSLFFAYRYPALRNLSVLTLLIALIIGIAAFISYTMSEIGVTNMRVLIKIGLFSASSFETMLQNIASIDVEQSFLGKILGYGTITICDKGSTRIPFENIEKPYEFRRKTQTEINNRYPPPKESARVEKRSEE